MQAGLGGAWASSARTGSWAFGSSAGEPGEGVEGFQCRGWRGWGPVPLQWECRLCQAATGRGNRDLVFWLTATSWVASPGLANDDSRRVSDPRSGFQWAGVAVQRGWISI